MTRETFKTLQSSAGLTNAAVAELLGVSLRAVEAWRQGSRGIKPPIAELIRIKFKQ